MSRQKMDPRKDPPAKPFTILLLLLVAICVEKVRPEELPFGSRRTSDCYLDNVLQTFLAPEDISSIQMQALRQELWRILTSPSMNEMPNFDLVSDGKLLYDHPMFENKRSSVFERMITASPYFEKYLATVAKANSMKSRPSMMGKKSIATLAKNGQLPTLQSPEENSETEEEKRNVESLARLGGIHQYMKKSLESLVRNGYLNRPEDNPDSFGKRNVGSLARNGELQHKNTGDNYVSYYKRNIQNLMRTGGVSGGKRNIASLIRNQNMPIYGEYENQKRNIGTIARDWSLPNHGAGWPRDGEDKRNVAALLRQDSYLHSANRNPAIDAVPTPEAEEVSEAESKRNLPSIKTGPFKYGKTIVKRSAASNKEPKNTNEPESKTPARQKRQADEYFSEISNDFPLPDVPKSDGFDYDEFVKALTGDYLSNKKRFLGNIPLSRMTELGKISLMGQQPMSNATPTSPTYRRRQYLLSRTQPDENE